MNKASRKSGGTALKQAPEGLLALLELMNLLMKFVHSQKMHELIKSGYEDHLPSAGIKVTMPQNGSRIDRLGKLFRAFSVSDDVKSKIKWLTAVVCAMPERLALDLLERCPAYERAGAPELLGLMKDADFNLFGSLFIEDEEDEKSQSATRNFYYSMNRFEELFVIHNLLCGAQDHWGAASSPASNIVRSRKSDDLLLFPDVCQLYRPFVYVEPDSKLNPDFRPGESFELLRGVERKRIRICPRCAEFYWAGRKDLKACSACSEKIRKKKWRNHNLKKKDEGR